MGSSSNRAYKNYIIEHTCQKIKEQEEEFERQLERERQINLQKISLLNERQNQYFEEKRRSLEERKRRIDEQLWKQQQQLGGNFGNLQMLQDLNLDFQY